MIHMALSMYDSADVRPSSLAAYVAGGGADEGAGPLREARCGESLSAAAMLYGAGHG